MTLAERIARSLLPSPRLVGVPIPVIEEVTRQALAALENLALPDGVTLSDALNAEWETCEGCEAMLPADVMEHDMEGVPLCPPCMNSLKAEAPEDAAPARSLDPCCYIPPEEQAAAAAGECVDGCSKPAEFDIIPNDQDVNNGTRACIEHVGHMLMDGVNHVSAVEKEEIPCV